MRTHYLHKTEFVSIPELPTGISNEQFQRFINMPEKLQKKFIESHQNQQKRVEWSQVTSHLRKNQIEQKLRDAEERKNLNLALKQSKLIGHHDKIANSQDVYLAKVVDQIGELAVQRKRHHDEASERYQKIIEERKAKARMVTEKIEQSKKARETEKVKQIQNCNAMTEEVKSDSQDKVEQKIKENDQQSYKDKKPVACKDEDENLTMIKEFDSQFNFKKSYD